MAEVVNMPKLGFDMAEGTLVRWVIAEGEGVEKGQVLAEIETDKATIEVESSATGLILKHIVSEGTAVPVGNPIAVIGQADEEFDLGAMLAEVEAAEPAVAIRSEAAPGRVPAPTRPDEEPLEAKQKADGSLPGGVRASPVARRLAAQQNIELKDLIGTGPGGRVVKQDVEAALKSRERAPGALEALLPEAISRETTRFAASRLRAAIGRRMTAAKQQVPHFYVTAELDAAPLMTLRGKLNDLLAEEAAKLSVNDFIVKAAALTLRAFPNLNASLDGDEILRHGQINVGIAVAVDDGLLTVVVRDADVKPLQVISREAHQMVGHAREGKVRPEEIEGATFTVSNLGMYEVDHFIAIINPPEAAIMAVGSVRTVPVVAAGEIVVGQRIKVTLSADHRVTDGAEAAEWLRAFVGYMEQPLRLMI